MENPGHIPPGVENPADSWVIEGRRLRDEELAEQQQKRRERGVIGAALLALVLMLNGLGALWLFPTQVSPRLAALVLFVLAIALAGGAVMVVRRLR